MADVNQVVTQFTVDDQFTVKVAGMTKAVQTFGTSAAVAQRQVRGIASQLAGGRFAPLVQGFQQGFGGAIQSGLSSMSAFAAGGSRLARVLTVPTRLIGAFGQGLTMLGIALAPLTGGLSLLISLIGQLTKALGDAIGSILRIIGDLATTAFKAVGALGVAAAGIGVFAAKAAGAFDTLERSFAAFTGSVEKGRQAALFVEAFGLRSPFEQQALQEAARSLLAVGADLRTFLTLAQNIALFRGPSGQNIIEVAELIQRALTGATGFAFGPRGLRRFGLTQEDLEAAGARFRTTSQGAIFQGGAAEAERVLANLLQLPKVRDIGKLFETSPVVRFSNAMDALMKVMREIGKSILSFVVPVVETLANALAKVGQSGIFGRALESLFRRFSDVGLGLEGIVSRIAALTAAIIQNLPDIFTTLMQGVKQFVSVWLTFFRSVLSVIGALSPLFSVGVKAALDLLNRAIAGFKNLDVTKAVQADAAKFLKEIQQAKPPGEVAPPQVEKPPTATPAAAAPITPRAAELASGGDIRRFALGGGGVGRFGLTDVERARIGALGAQPEIRVKVKVFGADKWNDILSDLFEQAIAEWERRRPRIVRGATQ